MPCSRWNAFLRVRSLMPAARDTSPIRTPSPAWSRRNSQARSTICLVERIGLPLMATGASVIPAVERDFLQVAGRLRRARSRQLETDHSGPRAAAGCHREQTVVLEG